MHCYLCADENGHLHSPMNNSVDDVLIPAEVLVSAELFTLTIAEYLAPFTKPLPIHTSIGADRSFAYGGTILGPLTMGVLSGVSTR